MHLRSRARTLVRAEGSAVRNHSEKDLHSDNQRSPAIFLTHATQLLTLRGKSGDTSPRRGARCASLGIIEDGAVLIADGKIVAVGTTDEVAKHDS